MGGSQGGLFANTAQHDEPTTPHTPLLLLQMGANGIRWPLGGNGCLYATPAFTGNVSEAAQVSEAFPSAPDGTLLRQVDEYAGGHLPDGGNSLLATAPISRGRMRPMKQSRRRRLSWYAMILQHSSCNLSRYQMVEAERGSGIQPGALTAYARF